jgi:hypothetical protein
MHLRYAYKEWSAILHGLATGQQSILLRKGGIAEGPFQPLAEPFAFYPTYVHQQTTGLADHAADWLTTALAHAPPTGQVPLTLVAELVGVYHVTDVVPLLLLADWHGWSETTVRQRFAYRTPGLHVQVVRVHRLTEPIVLTETPAFAGCKTWVELPTPIDVQAKPVLDDAAFADVVERVARRLNATAMV